MPEVREPIIRVVDLTAAYQGTVIIENVSFDVERGEVFVIAGGSGAGKSTLLKHMIGLHKPLSGQVLIGGEDIVTAEGQDRQRILERIGVAYQMGALFGSMSVLENVRLPLEEFSDLPRGALDLIALMKLKLVGLEAFAYHMPSELSGGMQKRAAIARAMALDPEILFLDEPWGGLDPLTAAEVDELILRLARSLKVTSVIVSHHLGSIFTVADRVALLDERIKGILAVGRPGYLRDHCDDPRVRRFFSPRGERDADG